MRIGAYFERNAGQQYSKAENSETSVIALYFVFSVLFGTMGIMIFEEGNDAYKTIGDGLWWCIVTLTTVGYGDKYPLTIGGQIVASVVMFIGLSFLRTLNRNHFKLSHFTCELTQGRSYANSIVG